VLETKCSEVCQQCLGNTAECFLCNKKRKYLIPQRIGSASNQLLSKDLRDEGWWAGETVLAMARHILEEHELVLYAFGKEGIPQRLLFHA
jgi:hypothetical protein